MSRCSFAQASTDDASVACHPAQFLDIVKLLSRSAELARRTTLFHVKHHILLRAVCHPSAMPSTSVRTHMIGTDERPSSPKLTHTAGGYDHLPPSLLVPCRRVDGSRNTSRGTSTHKRRLQP